MIAKVALLLDALVGTLFLETGAASAGECKGIDGRTIEPTKWIGRNAWLNEPHHRMFESDPIQCSDSAFRPLRNATMQSPHNWPEAKCRSAHLSRPKRIERSVDPFPFTF